MCNGWLINDCLTCIPGTKTFWHNLLDWFPKLEDKTNGHTPFKQINSKLNNDYKIKKPDYIIRNGTFFDVLDISKTVKTISLIQDVYDGHLKEMQKRVINNSHVVVFNSPFIYNYYKDVLKNIQSEIIPLGTDFDFFKPLNKKTQLQTELGILPDSILYVGSTNNYPKGFDLLMDIVEKTKYNFCFVLKHPFDIVHPRIKVFNCIDHNMLLKVYNACVVLICTSRMETLHLAGIEAAACDLPILTTNVGIYHNRHDGLWGQKEYDGFKNLDTVMNNIKMFKPREYFIKEGLDLPSCKNKWTDIINNLLNESI